MNRLCVLLILIIICSLDCISQTKPFKTEFGVCNVPSGWNDSALECNSLDFTIPPKKGVAQDMKITGGFYHIFDETNFDNVSIGQLWRRNKTGYNISEAKETVEAMHPVPLRKSAPKWSYDKATDTWICECTINGGGGINGVMYQFDEKRTIFMRYRSGKAYFMEISVSAFNKSVDNNKAKYDAIYRSWKVPGDKR